MKMIYFHLILIKESHSLEKNVEENKKKINEYKKREKKDIYNKT